MLSESQIEYVFDAIHDLSFQSHICWIGRQRDFSFQVKVDYSNSIRY